MLRSDSTKQKGIQKYTKVYALQKPLIINETARHEPFLVSRNAEEVSIWNLHKGEMYAYMHRKMQISSEADNPIDSGIVFLDNAKRILVTPLVSFSPIRVSQDGKYIHIGGYKQDILLDRRTLREIPKNMHPNKLQFTQNHLAGSKKVFVKRYRTLVVQENKMHRLIYMQNYSNGEWLVWTPSGYYMHRVKMYRRILNRN